MPKGIPFDEEQLGQIKVGLALGKTTTSIARSLGVTAEGVRQAGLRQAAEIGELQRQNNEELAALYEGKAREMAEAITPKKIKDAKARDLAVGSGIMLDKSLLLRGQPTERHEVSLVEIDRELTLYLHEAQVRGLDVRKLVAEAHDADFTVEDALFAELDEVKSQALPTGDSAASKAGAQESEQ